MMNIDCIIGIDVGVNGGISVWRPNEYIKVLKMPEKISDVKAYLSNQQDICACPIVVIEKVNLRPDDTAHFGKAIRANKMVIQYEMIKNVLDELKMPYVMVHPSAWMAYLNLRKSKEERKDRKNRLKKVAQELYPEIKATLWNSDAILIMHFLKKKIAMDKNWVYSNLPSHVHRLFD